MAPQQAGSDQGPPQYHDLESHAAEQASESAEFLTSTTTSSPARQQSASSSSAFMSRPSAFRALDRSDYRALPPIPPGLSTYTPNRNNGTSNEAGESQSRSSDESNLSIPDMEFFDIEDESAASSTASNPWVRASQASKRLAQKINKRLISPVQKIVVDPVARVWTNINSRLDTALGRFGNPLMFRRLLYLLIVSLSVFFAVAFGFVPTVNGPDGINHDGIFSQQFHDHRAIRAHLQNSILASQMMENVEYMSSMSHLAGTQGDYVLTKYIEKSMRDYGLRPVEVRNQHVYLTAPDENADSRRLELFSDGASVVVAKLRDGIILPNPSDSQAQPNPYHALSSPGKVQGKLVYVGRGTARDFMALEKANIDLKGSVAFIRLGDGLPTYKKLREAKERGAKGVVTFTVDEEYPDSIMRADVSYIDRCPGDILTPGWSSQDRHNMIISPSDSISLSHIPSIPISWTDAKAFLSEIKGKGVKLDEAGDLWSGGVDNKLEVFLESNPVVERKHKIWNVLGKIDGMEQNDKAIIIGSQRDSFCYGASDPLSGTAVLLEVARVLSELNRQMGWVPLRSVYFASWDASTQNLAGSTEWVEFNADLLSDEGVVYLQLDQAVSGNSVEDLEVQGHPLLQRAVTKVFEQVTNPAHNTTNLMEFWKTSSGRGKLARLQPDRDHTPFTFHAGIPSLRMSFTGNPDQEADDLITNTCRDTFDTLKSQDPYFAYHKAMAEAIAMLVLKFSDEPLVDFDVDEYFKEIKDFSSKLPESIDSKLLDDIIPLLQRKATFLSSWRDSWYKVVVQTGETPMTFSQRNAWNSRLTIFDRNLIFRPGMHRRPWYRHQIFGPEDTLPMVREAAGEAKQKEAIEELVKSLTLAAHTLFD